MTRTPLLIGHRGSPRAATENTIASFRAAISAGLDGLETDVHLTADGVLVLHHDPNLSGGALITTLTLAQLRSQAPHVPLLDDLLPVLDEYGTARLNLELKSPVPHADERAEALCEALSGWPGVVRERVWLSTFDRSLLRELERGFVARGVVVPLAFLLSRSDADGVPDDVQLIAVHPHHSLVDGGSVTEWHADGLAVHAWTVNEASLAQRLIGAGVDGLIGDVPEMLLAARDAARAGP